MVVKNKKNKEENKAVNQPMTKENKKLLSAIAYILTWLTGIIMLVVAITKKDKELGFHGIQAILVGIFFLIVSLVLAVIPIIGWIILPLWSLISLIAALALAYFVYTGKEFELPVITDLSKNLVKDLVK